MASLLPKRHRRLLLIALIVVLAALLFPSDPPVSAEQSRQPIDLSAPVAQISLPSNETSEPASSDLNNSQDLHEKANSSQSTANQAHLQQASSAAPQASPSLQSKPISALTLNATENASKESLKASEVQQRLSQFDTKQPLQRGVRYRLDLAIESSQLKPEEEHFYTLKRQTVKSGDSMALLFSRVGLSAKSLYQIDQLGGEAHQLRTLHPGDKLDFYLDENDQLIELRYPRSKYQTLIIERDEQQQFQARVETKALEIRTNFARGNITSSFWNAGISAQLSQGQIMALAAIFGWDIDFALDIRSNDSFMVLFEEYYVDGQYAGNGNIIAAEFINQGEVFRAVRNDDDDNYYSPEGRPMRKAFLRAPVNFKYISSNFNPRRLHPVTGKVRPHNGIDYAAKPGTPVQAAGDGRVIKSGYNQYNGNYVFIQHSSAYVTKYLHLKKRYVKTGQRIKQGKIIGTVGATGRVTGPHLHYEFLVHGVHKNPRTVKLPTSTPLKGDKKKRFLPTAKSRIAQLDNTKRVLLAMN
ncbi:MULTISPECIES: peptidoglycan DD-metalloendopeptidase family protein [unclassified Agarivorans]|uniref:peptidoglycan DD-metalloendopeptidase family protein n=1 Tax=unclassified Agarivorans TaxID=2636026 RepID=UPI003D7D1F07